MSILPSHILPISQQAQICSSPSPLLALLIYLRITPLRRNLQGLPRILSVKPASSPGLRNLYDLASAYTPKPSLSGPLSRLVHSEKMVFYTTKQVRASLVLFPLLRILSATPQLTEPALLFSSGLNFNAAFSKKPLRTTPPKAGLCYPLFQV